MFVRIKQFITRKLGVDKAIFYTLVGRSLGIPVSVLTIFFIARFLSPEEQGYYYTFGSIVALQVFFELGLGGIITQFVAHEVSHLKWNGNEFEGEERYKSRLASLLRFCTKWYLIFAGAIVVLLMIAGFTFFSHYDAHGKDISWALPWIILVAGTAFNFLIAPITSFVEGLGKVKEMAEIRLIQQVLQPIVVWGGFALGAKLFVSGMDAILKVSVVFLFILNSHIRKMLVSIWKEKVSEYISYKKEIFPLQWRIAVSWVSGYFIFQLFNPVLFATEGAKVAGQMGLTMQALNALQALALSWINTKVPRISGHIALKEYVQLDTMFNKTFKQVMAIGFCFLILFVSVLIVFQKMDVCLFGVELSDRFLPVIPLLLMAWCTFTMIPVNCWATYLRCHKKEPLMLNSVVLGISSSVCTVTFGNLYGLMGIVVSFALLRLLSLVWIRYVYKTKKIEWHQDGIE